MYKGTTPTFIFTFPPDFDPSQAAHVILTFSANKKNSILEKDETELDIGSDYISAYLTQEETLQFPTGKIYCQINFLYDDTSRASTDIQAFAADNNLHGSVMQ